MKKIFLTLVSLSLVFGADALAASTVTTGGNDNYRTTNTIVKHSPLAVSVTSESGLKLPSTITYPNVPVDQDATLRTISCDGDSERYKIARYIHDVRAANTYNIVKNLSASNTLDGKSPELRAIAQENANYNHLKTLYCGDLSGLGPKQSILKCGCVAFLPRTSSSLGSTIETRRRLVNITL